LKILPGLSSAHSFQWSKAENIVGGDGGSSGSDSSVDCTDERVGRKQTDK